MLLSPVIPAFNIYDRINKKIVTIQQEEIPDLIIQEANYVWIREEWPGHFVLFVLNNGEGEVPSGPRKEVVNVYWDYLFLPFRGQYSVEKTYNNHESHPPSKVENYYIPESDKPGFSDIIRIFFWINPSKDIKESEYENNGIWAYYKSVPRDEYYFNFVIISDFHQWKTDGKPPWGNINNIDNTQNSQITQQQNIQQTISKQTVTIQQIKTTIKRQQFN
jgi:hypothetical protein